MRDGGKEAFPPSRRLRTPEPLTLILTLTRFWGVGEEKFDTIETGGFYEQISTDLHKRIQATSSSTI
jgi:hypothetical protein